MYKIDYKIYYKNKPKRQCFAGNINEIAKNNEFSWRNEEIDSSKLKVDHRSATRKLLHIND